MVTDSYYTNLAFWDGTSWVTPKSHLLNGIKRTHLIQQGQLKEQPITASDIFKFEKVSLINAMLNLDEVVLPINSDTIF